MPGSKLSHFLSIIIELSVFSPWAVFGRVAGKTMAILAGTSFTERRADFITHDVHAKAPSLAAHLHMPLPHSVPFFVLIGVLGRAKRSNFDVPWFCQREYSN